MSRSFQGQIVSLCSIGKREMGPRLKGILPVVFLVFILFVLVYILSIKIRRSVVNALAFIMNTK